MPFPDFALFKKKTSYFLITSKIGCVDKRQSRVSGGRQREEEGRENITRGENGEQENDCRSSDAAVRLAARLLKGARSSRCLRSTGCEVAETDRGTLRARVDSLFSGSASQALAALRVVRRTQDRVLPSVIDPLQVA